MYSWNLPWVVFVTNTRTVLSQHRTENEAWRSVKLHHICGLCLFPWVKTWLWLCFCCSWSCCVTKQQVWGSVPSSTRRWAQHTTHNTTQQHTTPQRCSVERLKRSCWTDVIKPVCLCHQASQLIVNYDEHEVNNTFKFGVIYQRFGQVPTHRSSLFLQEMFDLIL